MENQLEEKITTGEEELTIQVGALIEIMGGVDNIVQDVSGETVIRTIAAFNEPGVETMVLSILGNNYYQDYGVEFFTVMTDIMVADINLLTSVMSIDEEAGKINSILRCIVNVNGSVSVVVINNISFEESFNKWFTLNKHMGKMLRKQHTLNVNTNGANYLAGLTDKGKPIDWHLCVVDELCELLNSTPWKHWKEGKFDYKNIFTETVDIYHFLLSIFMEDMYNGLSQTGVDTEAVITEASKYERFGFIHFCQLFTVIVAIESSKGDELALDKLLLDLAKYHTKNNSNHTDNTVLIVMTFVLLSIAHPAINKSTDDFIKKYYAKNTLNQFRQDNGYGKDGGGYIKIWNGLEDNIVLDTIIETVEVTEDIELDTVIYEQLTIAYTEVKKTS